MLTPATTLVMNDIDSDEFVVRLDDIFFYETSLERDAQGNVVPGKVVQGKKVKRYWVVLRVLGQHWEVTKGVFEKMKELLNEQTIYVKEPTK